MRTAYSRLLRIRSTVVHYDGKEMWELGKEYHCEICKYRYISLYLLQGSDVLVNDLLKGEKPTRMARRKSSPHVTDECQRLGMTWAKCKPDGAKTAESG